MLGGNASTFAIQFVGSVVIARLLGPAEMGIYAASIAVVWVLNAVVSAGLLGYVVREREMPPEKLGTVFALTLAQSLVIGGALLLGAPAMGWITHEPRVTVAVRWLAWFGALMPIYVTCTGTMQRAMAFERVAASSITNVLVSAIATIALAANGYSWRSQPIGAGAGVTAAVLVAVMFQRRTLTSAPLSLAYARPIIAYCSRIMLATLIQNVTNRVPDFVLTRASGVAATGLYNRGANLIDQFNNTVMNSFQRVLATQMARDRDTPAGIGPVYAKVSRAVTGLFWPAFAVLAILSTPVVAFLFGPKWVAAGPVLSIVAIAASINMIVAARAEVLITSGREKQLPRNEAIRGAIGVVLFTAAAYSGGLILAASTRIIDSLIAVVLYSPGIHAATGLSWSAMARAFVRSAAVAVLSAAPALGAMLWLDWPAQLGFATLFGILGACALVWLGSIFALDHDLAGEVAKAAGVVRARLPRFA